MLQILEFPNLKILKWPNFLNPNNHFPELQNFWIPKISNTQILRFRVWFGGEFFFYISYVCLFELVFKLFFFIALLIPPSLSDLFASFDKFFFSRLLKVLHPQFFLLPYSWFLNFKFFYRKKAKKKYAKMSFFTLEIVPTVWIFDQNLLRDTK